MTLPARWWVPDRATVVPDAVVLALLEPDGGDAAGDLAATLLGVHRAGAAACESVAKGGLPSEEGLHAALLSSQGAILDRFVHAVAKSDQPEYAALLVHDVLLDADVAALDLYRACVAKGVAPSVAASRVGMVYGVPDRHLGRYASLAADTKTNPAVLVDAADRTLLGFVAKIVAVETEDEKVEISKAPDGGKAAQEWDPKDHPRDKGGQFTVAGGAERLRRRTSGETKAEGEEEIPPTGAMERLRARLGIGHGPAQVGEKPAEQVEQRASQPREMRTARTIREGMRAMRQAPAAPREGGQRQTASRKASGRAAGKRELSRQMREIETFNRGTVAESTLDHWRTAYGGTGYRPPNDLLSPRSDSGGPYRNEHRPMAIFMPMSRFMSLRTKMAVGRTEDEPLLFRIGHVVEAASANAVSLMDDTSPERGSVVRDETVIGIERKSALALATTAANQDIGLTFMQPTVKPVMTFYEPSSTPDDVIAMERAFLRGDDEREDEHIFKAGDYAHEGITVLVHTHPSPDSDDAYDRPIPTVVEFRIKDPARMADTGSPRRPQWDLDPNQVYLMQQQIPETHWAGDPHHVMVKRYYIQPLDDQEAEHLMPSEVHKALEPAEQAAFERRVKRDSEGRFARTDTSSSVVGGAEALRRRTTGKPVESPAEALRRRTSKPQEQQKEQPPELEGRQSRELRTNRQMREARAAPPNEARNTQLTRMSARRAAGSRESKREMGERTVVQRAMERSRREQPLTGSKLLVMLDDNQHYQVLTPSQFRSLVANGFNADGTADIYGTAMQTLHQFGFSDVDGAIKALKVNTAEMIEANEGPVNFGVDEYAYGAKRKHLFRAKLRPYDDDDELDLGLKIREAFDKRSSLAQVYVVPGMNHADVYGNTQPIPPQILIEFDHDLDVASPIRLVPIGDYRTGELLHRPKADRPGSLGGVEEIGLMDHQPFNAPVRRYRAEQLRPPTYNPDAKRYAYGPRFSG